MSPRPSTPWPVRVLLHLLFPPEEREYLLVGLEESKLASAAGIFNFARMLAGSIGTAVAVTLWDERYIFHRSRLAENLHPDSPQYRQVAELLASRLPEPGSVLMALEKAVQAQARTMGMNDLNYLCVLAVLFAAMLAWLLPAHSQGADTI